MPTNNPFFVFDEKLCKAEGLTKEQIINLIAEATGTTPSHVDEGFISTIVETNRSRSIHIWKGSKSAFEALDSYDPNTLYVIEDDTTLDDMASAYDELEADRQEIHQSISSLRTDVDDLKEDTGWQNLMRNNVMVGKYRVKGGIAYFDINYDTVNFFPSVVPTSDHFELPVVLDLSGLGGYIPVMFQSDSSSSALKMAKGVLENNNDVTTIYIYSYPLSDIRIVQFSFSYPVAVATE